MANSSQKGTIGLRPSFQEFLACAAVAKREAAALLLETRLTACATMGFDLSEIDERPDTGFVLHDLQGDSSSPDRLRRKRSGIVLLESGPPACDGFRLPPQDAGFVLCEDAGADLPLTGGTPKKAIVMPVSGQWYSLIVTGRKNVEVRSFSAFWMARLQGATHVVFQHGYKASTKLPETRILAVERRTCLDYGELGNPPPGSAEYARLFGSTRDLIAIRFEAFDGYQSPIKSHLCFPPSDAGIDDHDLPLARAFDWPSFFWLALVSSLGSVAEIQSSLLGQKVKISTHCSGIGAAEMAAQMLMAHSVKTLGLAARIQCQSVCDTSRKCRAILAARSRQHSEGWHIFNDIFHLFPAWRQELLKPEAMVQELLQTCNTRAERRCQQHGRECAHPVVDGDLCGSPCPPWSRFGLRLGYQIA